MPSASYSRTRFKSPQKKTAVSHFQSWAPHQVTLFLQSYPTEKATWGYKRSCVFHSIKFQPPCAILVLILKLNLNHLWHRHETRKKTRDTFLKESSWSSPFNRVQNLIHHSKLPSVRATTLNESHNLDKITKLLKSSESREENLAISFLETFV